MRNKTFAYTWRLIVSAICAVSCFYLAENNFYSAAFVFVILSICSYVAALFINERGASSSDERI